jgi:hypothetical protein
MMIVNLMIVTTRKHQEEGKKEGRKEGKENIDNQGPSSISVN